MTRFTEFFRSFSQLRWKLTFSYTVVTVGALLAGELLLIALTLGVAYFLVSGDMLPSLIVTEMRETLAPELRPYLEQEPPDVEGIAAWLQNPGTSVDTGSQTQITVPTESNNARLYVIGADNTLLGALSDVEPAAIGQPLDPALIPNTESIIEAALSGSTDATELYTRTQGRLILVAPIMDEQNNEVLGVLIVDAEYVQGVTQAIAPLAQLIGMSLLCLTLAAGTLGTIFGFVTAKGLARRLKRLTDASDAWSQGRFAVYVEDSSADEIGQLAARLNRMAQQLQNLLDTRQELAVVEERNRLARDLHDSAKQQAFAAAAQIGAAKALITTNPDAAGAHIAEAEQLINALRKELSTLILELRPAELANQGLVSAISQYATDWSRQTSIDAAVRVQSERALPLEIEQMLFRVAQEALANIARHSHAAHVDLWLGYEPDSITLIISDDGHGFDPTLATEGFGLRSMRERASALDATFSIESTRDTGTRISVRCPVKE